MGDFLFSVFCVSCSRRYSGDSSLPLPFSPFLSLFSPSLSRSFSSLEGRSGGVTSLPPFPALSPPLRGEELRSIERPVDGRRTPLWWGYFLPFLPTLSCARPHCPMPASSASAFSFLSLLLFTFSLFLFSFSLFLFCLCSVSVPPPRCPARVHVVLYPRVPRAHLSLRLSLRPFLRHCMPACLYVHSAGLYSASPSSIVPDVIRLRAVYPRCFPSLNMPIPA